MAGPGPVGELRAAAALVFVEDLGSPALAQDDSHHLGGVLRLKAGETVAACDGKGSFRLCAFVSYPRRSAGDAGFGLEALGPVHAVSRRLPELEIGFSLAKADRTEWAVAKLVELGVDVLTPIVADRTVVRPDEKSSPRREARLSRIAREAAMQSRRTFLPRIEKPQSFDDVVSGNRARGVALAEPGGGPVSLKTPVVLVGPEGGWSPRELGLVEAKVSLGDGVLRVETAAVAAGVLLTALRAGAGLWG